MRRPAALKIGYHCLPEQYNPSACVSHMIQAEKYGFDTVWASDHFHPWVSKGQGGFAWVLLSAFAAMTKRIPFGTSVTAPTLRYHPAIVAQAFATLDCLFPGRVFLGLGTGEALNEMPLGYDWPKYTERAERLEEAIQIILRLWKGETLSTKGKYYTLRKAKLYTKPNGKIPLYIAAAGPTSAKLAGTYGNGVIILAGNLKLYDNSLCQSVDKAARQNNRDPTQIERVLELLVSYDEHYDRALKAARFWAPTMLPIVFKAALYDPHEIESLGEYIGDDVIEKNWLICNSPEDARKVILDYAAHGFDQIEITNASPDPEAFLKDIGSVLPIIRKNAKKGRALPTRMRHKQR